MVNAILTGAGKICRQQPANKAGHMRIDGTGRIITPARSGSAAPARGGASTFRLDGGQPAPSANQPAATMAAAGIDALLALQAVDDATSGRRKAIRRGNMLIDALERIQADLLAGRVSEGHLNKAIALLAQAKINTEPGLDALIADIELRVRVELAKLGRFPPL